MCRLWVLVISSMLATYLRAYEEERQLSQTRVSFETIDLHGPDCSQKAVSIIKNTDAASATILFHDFAIRASKILRKSKETKACEIRMSLKTSSPKNGAALIKIDYRGSLNLPPDSFGSFDKRYEEAHHTKKWQGKQEKVFFIRDALTVPFHRALQMRLRITVKTNASGDEANIALESIDVGAKF